MIDTQPGGSKNQEIAKALQLAYDALLSKGFDPIEQLWGYLLSEDPTHITTYNGARQAITRFKLEDLLRFLLRSHFNV